MPYPEIINLAERFQTTLVGIVGFVGVIWTLHANARHSQNVHKRQLTDRKEALRRILAAEFRNYAGALNKNASVEMPDLETVSVGRMPRLLSEPLMADLGLLDLHEVDIVVNALISLEGMTHYLENLAEQSSETRFLVPVKAWDEFVEINAQTAKALGYAIEALELSGHV